MPIPLVDVDIIAPFSTKIESLIVNGEYYILAYFNEMTTIVKLTHIDTKLVITRHSNSKKFGLYDIHIK